MRYVSTRGAAPAVGFAGALLDGLAPDGGLYVPEGLPAPEAPPSHLSPLGDPARAELAGRPEGTYPPLAAAVMAPFVDDPAGLVGQVEAAYRTFDHPEVLPLVELGDGRHLLELFHGPTLAFKDVALQLVGRLMDAELRRRGERRTVVVATSGDTGSAAIAACLGRGTLDVVVLHPAGRVSDVQRRQMTTVDAPNVHNLAVEGTFDDCQDLVKALFADEAFRAELALGAMNSINWGRILAQIPYYLWVGARLGPCVVVVPTGNFGNILAGWYARALGAPVERLVMATNRNDILARWAGTGVLRTEAVVPTLSPAMDIQVSSNHERLLFDLLGRDGAATAELIGRFRRTGSAEAPSPPDVFAAVRVDDDATLAEMGAMHRHHGRLVDPHTAVGLRAAAMLGDTGLPVVCLATAHPAKFPDAVERATGIRAALPARLADLAGRPEHYDVAPAELGAVQAWARGVLAAGQRRGS